MQRGLCRVVQQEKAATQIRSQHEQVVRCVENVHQKIAEHEHAQNMKRVRSLPRCVQAKDDEVGANHKPCKDAALTSRVGRCSSRRAQRTRCNVSRNNATKGPEGNNARRQRSLTKGQKKEQTSTEEETDGQKEDDQRKLGALRNPGPAAPTSVPDAGVLPLDSTVTGHDQK